MLKSRILVLTVSIILLLSVAACTAKVQTDNIVANCIKTADENSKDTDYLELEIDENNVNIIAIVDRNIIYEQSAENDVQTIIYYNYDMDNNTTYEIGQIANTHIYTGSMAQIEDKLYFYMNTLTFDNNSDGEVISRLYEIDITKNTLNEILNEEVYQTLIYVGVIDGELLSYKGKVEGNTGISYIDTININNKEQNILVSSIIDMQSGIGEVINNFTQADGFIYTLENNYSEDKSVHNIKKYNANGDLMRTIELGDTIVTALNNEPISTFSVIGDYAFLRNFSATGIICDISGDTAIPLVTSYESFDLAVAANNVADTNYAIFYQRNTEMVWLFDADNGTFNQLETGYEKVEYIVVNDKGNALIQSPDEIIAIFINYMNYPISSTMILSEEDPLIYGKPIFD